VAEHRTPCQDQSEATANKGKQCTRIAESVACHAETLAQVQETITERTNFSLQKHLPKKTSRNWTVVDTINILKVNRAF